MLGYHPFFKAERTDPGYKLLKKGQNHSFWKRVKGKALTPAFKDLIQKLLSYDGDLRPTIEEIKNHKWMRDSSYDEEATRQYLIAKLARKKGAKEAPHSTTNSSQSSNLGAAAQKRAKKQKEKKDKKVNKASNILEFL